MGIPRRKYKVATQKLCFFEMLSLLNESLFCYVLVGHHVIIIVII